MKRIIFFGFVLMFTSIAAYSQSPLDLGVKGGITSSTFTLDNISSIYYGNEQLNYTGSDFIKDASNGLNIGLFARVKFNRLFLQPELNFVVRNGKMNLNIQDADTENPSEIDYITQTLKLSTLDIPILVGFTVLDLKVLKLNVFTGPSAAIILNESIDLTPKFNIESDENIESRGISINKPFTERFNLGEELKTATWNWQAGIGVDIANFYVDARYEMGITNLSTLDFEQKTNMLMLSVGFRFF